MQTTNADQTKQWGIEVAGVKLAGAGRMLDFRYRVVDPVKALAVLRADARERPYVIDQATGSRLPVPRPAADVPHEARAPAATGRVYYTLFANPGCLVKEGDKVTVVIGKFRVKDLVVQ